MKKILDASIETKKVKTAVMDMLGDKPNLVFVTLQIEIYMMVKAYGRKYFKVAPQSSDANFYNDLLAMAFKKGSSLTRHFSNLYVIFIFSNLLIFIDIRFIFQFFQAYLVFYCFGLIDYWTQTSIDYATKTDYFQRSHINVTWPSIIDQENDYESWIDLEHLSVMFYFIEVGLVVAFIQLLIEMVYYYY